MTWLMLTRDVVALSFPLTLQYRVSLGDSLGELSSHTVDGGWQMRTLRTSWSLPLVPRCARVLEVSACSTVGLVEFSGGSRFQIVFTTFDVSEKRKSSLLHLGIIGGPPQPDLIIALRSTTFGRISPVTPILSLLSHLSTFPLSLPCKVRILPQQPFHPLFNATHSLDTSCFWLTLTCSAPVLLSTQPHRCWLFGLAAF
ncbi:hypothetical protein EV401DRAFT_1926591 [Pisolithus croceorrhizus]|nr:hypothetical protein EV401DRAFT_1926591 [Pisolithus croceorrhizus]